MKKLLGLLLVIAFASISAMAYANGDNDDNGDNGETADPETYHELRQVRKATHQYVDVSAAENDGYVRISNHVPGQGIHYLNPELVDDTFDLDKPELLVYVERDDSLELVAVEYAVPVPLSPENPPEGFTGDTDEWNIHPAACHYTDHSEIFVEELDSDECPQTHPETEADLSTQHPDLRVLHAWTWLGNPSGIFAHTNPIVE